MSVGSDKLRLLRRIPSVRFDEEMRGYSKSQVDRVLDTLAPLADEIETLQEQLVQAQEQAELAQQRADTAGMGTAAPAAVASPDGDFDETLRNTLLLAQRTADQTVRDAEAAAEQVRNESTAKADSLMAGARAEAKELKGEAHAQREQMLADAESERAQLLADALEHAETRKQAIEEELLAEQGIRRNELLAEISQLERSRDDLSADVDRFERFLEGRRESIRSALVELDAVLSDPELLAEAELPEPAEIGLLDPEDLTGLDLESHSISTLSTEVDAARQQAADFAFTASGDDNDADDATAAGPVGDAADHSDDDGSSEAAEPDTGGWEDYDTTGSDAPEPSPAEEFAAAIGQQPPFEIEESFAASETEAAFDPPPPAAGSEAFGTPGAFDPADSFTAEAAADNVVAPGAVAPGGLDSGSAQQFHEPATSSDSEAEIDSGNGDWQPFEPEVANGAGTPFVSESSVSESDAADNDPFATSGFSPAEEAPTIPASVTGDSVFSSVPEIDDPTAYADLQSATDPDPAGLGIDVESPFAEAGEEPAPAAVGLGGLAEQARSRLASRVSRLRDTAVAEDPADSADAVVEASDLSAATPVAEDFAPPPPMGDATTATPSFPPPPENAYGAEEAHAEYGSASPFAETSRVGGQPFEEQPFHAQADSGYDGSEQYPVDSYGEEQGPAFASDQPGGAAWDAPDPNRPRHPDAQIEDLPPDDPFLDELRQMTAGEESSEDETFNRFLSDEGEKDAGGGWFGRRK